MVVDDVGEIIARRSIELDGAPAFEILIGAPKATPGQADEYFCPYKIVGFAPEVIRYGIGIDSVQALELTLMMIGTELYTSEQGQAGRLSWVGGAKDGDLGLPVPDNIKDVLP